jgi:predicted RNA-binding Zn-ribbon protein involved in translation (DUF1610 family)
VRCQTCGYSLWNIAARECPECGASFLPSEFEFVPGTVRFQCPHCGHDYYGSGDRGHLSPRSFTCEECKAAIDIDGMVLLPESGLSEEDTEPGVMPWIERKRRGLLKAFLGTILLAMTRPARLMRGVPKSASVGEALVFGIAMSAVTLALGLALPTIGYWAWNALVWGWGPEFWEILWMAVMVAFAFFFVAGIIPLWAVCSHAVLRVTGGTRYSVDRTLQALGYSAGANVISAVPFVGWMLGGLWWSVSAVIMLSTGQKVHAGRAVVAVLALPAAIAVSVGVAVGLASWWASTTLTFGPMGGGWAGLQLEASAVHNGLIAHALSNNQQGPAHALKLLADGNVQTYGWRTGSAFCHPATLTTPDDVPVGDGTLKALQMMDQLTRQQKLDPILEDLPEGIIAHRLGDFVFTYHGAVFDGRDADFWVLVMLPDPEINGTPAPDDSVLIGTGEYLSDLWEIPYSSLVEALKEQNEYRATIGLPPLPDLLTVTHGEPALAAD